MSSSEQRVHPAWIWAVGRFLNYELDQGNCIWQGKAGTLETDIVFIRVTYSSRNLEELRDLYNLKYLNSRLNGHDLPVSLRWQIDNFFCKSFSVTVSVFGKSQVFLMICRCKNNTISLSRERLNYSK